MSMQLFKIIKTCILHLFKIINVANLHLFEIIANVFRENPCFLHAYREFLFKR